MFVFFSHCDLELTNVIFKDHNSSLNDIKHFVADNTSIFLLSNDVLSLQEMRLI